MVGAEGAFFAVAVGAAEAGRRFLAPPPERALAAAAAVGGAGVALGCLPFQKRKKAAALATEPASAASASAGVSLPGAVVGGVFPLPPFPVSAAAAAATVPLLGARSFQKQSWKSRMAASPVLFF